MPVKKIDMKTSWQTTAGGVLAAVGAVLGAVGTALSQLSLDDPDYKWINVLGTALMAVGPTLLAVGTGWLGLAARDNGVSSEEAGAK